MKQVFQNTVTFALAAALGVLLVNALVAERTVADLVHNNDRVAHTHRVLEALETAESLVKDAETGQRGYLITGRDEHLDPYSRAIAGFDTHLQRLRELVADNPLQQQNVEALGQLVFERFGILREVVERQRTAGPDAARDLVRAGRGLPVMNEIRNLVGEMKAVEQRLLDERAEAARRSFRIVSLANGLGAGLGIALIGLSFALFRRDTKNREEAAADLKRLNDELENRVQHRTEALSRAVDHLHSEVTDRTRAQEAANAATVELRRSNRELQEFAQVASHDLQEPLRKIQAFGDRLGARSGDALDDTAQDFLRRMLDAAARMRRLIDDLLTFARVTTRARPPEPVDLRAVAEEVVADLQGRLQETGGRIEVGDLPTVEAEPTQMRQLLQNLLGNAVKFHRPDVPPVVTITGRATNEDSVEVTVADNGIGFDEKYLDRIFNVFQRLHGRAEYDGTGMGLAIVRKIVDQHGGTITAQSRPGEGAAFVVTLPVRSQAYQEVA